MQPSYWQNYPSATHYQGWEHEPIPGWGVRPVMAGPRMVGVGAAPSHQPTTTFRPCPRGQEGVAIPMGPDGIQRWACVRGGVRAARAGVGDDVSDIPFLCAAQQQLYATARKLYPGDDARQFAYILTNGPGFAGDWQVWCAQHPDVAAPSKGGSMTPVALSTSSMPWWVWLAVPVVLGGAYAFTREMGWIGKKA